MLLAFIVGSVVFIVPAGMLLSRGQIVETTDFHMVPSIVRIAQRSEAIWSDKTLRSGCGGLVHRRFIAGNDIWIFPPVHTVQHGDVGSMQRFHTPWIVPDLPPGKAVFRKDIERWCNPIQKWVWPMWEMQEAPFEVIESVQGPH